MTPEATAIAAAISVDTEDTVSAGAITLQTIEQRTRAIAEVAEGRRRLLAFAEQALRRLYWHGMLPGRV